MADHGTPTPIWRRACLECGLYFYRYISATTSEDQGEAG